ncbi:MAG: VTC domain-containing protein, partial [Spirochaetaceae bacterium]|nr:VTC domain-containing protein [Spirochaetaceae bacterium]
MNKPAYQSSYVEGIKEFNTIDLNGLSSIKLLNRHDTKFVMPIEILNDVLNELKNDYKALNIDDNLIGKYETQYYDSPDLSLYRIHQNGKKSRFKIRTRSYLNNNESFLEIKQKNNKNRTSKK